MDVVTFVACLEVAVVITAAIRGLSVFYYVVSGKYEMDKRLKLACGK